jgi:hypothetical protein
MKKLFLFVIFCLPSIIFGEMRWYLVTNTLSPGGALKNCVISFNGYLWNITATSPRGNVLRSADGRTWVRVCDSIPWAYRAGELRRDYRLCVFHNKIWSLGGAFYYQSGGPIYLNDVWYTVDGINWICATESAAWRSRGNACVVVRNDTMWLMGGWRNNPSILYNDVWYTTDGITWICATDSAEWLPGWNYDILVSSRGQFWLFCDGLYYPTFELWVSSDGIHWYRIATSTPWTPRKNYAVTNRGDTIWVAGGSRLDSTWIYLNDVWYTTDGITWICATDSAEWEGRDQHALVVHNNLLWLIGGYNGIQGYREVWYSTGLSGIEEKKFFTQSITSVPTIFRSISDFVIHQSNLFDITGRKVERQHLRRGVYFLKEKEYIQKVILLK